MLLCREPSQHVSVLVAGGAQRRTGSMQRQTAAVAYNKCCRFLLPRLLCTIVCVSLPRADFATLIGKPVDFFTFPYKSYSVDFLAAGLVIACCLLLIFTTAGGSWFNILMVS